MRSVENKKRVGNGNYGNRTFDFVFPSSFMIIWRASASETNEISGVSFYFRLFAEAHFNAHCLNIAQ